MCCVESIRREMKRKRKGLPTTSSVTSPSRSLSNNLPPPVSLVVHPRKNHIPTTETAPSLLNAPLFFSLSLSTLLPLHLLATGRAHLLSLDAAFLLYLIPEGGWLSRASRATSRGAAPREMRNRVAWIPQRDEREIRYDKFYTTDDYPLVVVERDRDRRVRHSRFKFFFFFATCQLNRPWSNSRWTEISWAPREIIRKLL